MNKLVNITIFETMPILLHLNMTSWSLNLFRHCVYRQSNILFGWVLKRANLCNWIRWSGQKMKTNLLPFLHLITEVSPKDCVKESPRCWSVREIIFIYTLITTSVTFNLSALYSTWAEINSVLQTKHFLKYE
jgi:hypothetical protein